MIISFLVWVLRHKVSEKQAKAVASLIYFTSFELDKILGFKNLRSVITMSDVELHNRRSVAKEIEFKAKLAMQQLMRMDGPDVVSLDKYLGEAQMATQEIGEAEAGQVRHAFDLAYDFLK